MIIIVLRQSYDATLMEGCIKTILVGKMVNKQRLVAFGYIPSVVSGKCLNALNYPGWHWDLSYFLLACNHAPRL